MSVSRIDLADATTPERLVLDILKHEPNLKIPVPIEELCFQLDITEIVPLTTKGYEGGLITPVDKFNGSILFNEQSPRTRLRFTIAHELGHFLMPSHVPSEEGRFLCRLQDMLALKANEGDRRQKMEVEANRFASNILMPAPLFRPDSGRGKDPDLRHVVDLAAKYDVSKEAAGRAYVQFREEAVAFLVTHEGKLMRDYRNPAKFPALAVPRNRPVSDFSLLRRRKHQIGVPSDLDEIDAGVWMHVERGRQAPKMYEQIYLQQKGFALVLLVLEKEDDDEDAEADMTAKERYQRRRATWQ
jgi:Zn-dependent peptidase ImmA (M78 family)